LSDLNAKKVAVDARLPRIIQDINI